MSPPLPDPEEDDYMSEEDSDFAPDAVVEDELLSASDNEGPTVDKPTAKPPNDNEAEDAGFVNSGDEAIIEKGKKRRKKKRKTDDGAADNEENDEDGEGGLIKTRSMRAVEKAKKHTAAASSGPVTIDVDSLWAQMNSEPTSIPKPTEIASQETTQAKPTTAAAATATADDQSYMIRIKRTYNFAGKVHSEEKLVARDTAEAKLYLASLGGENANNAEETAEQPKRMPRKAFRSAFEPITDQTLQGGRRADLNLGVSVRLRARELANEANAKKLNTVEKSRMDWAGYVDKEGIKDELELAGKSKDSFAARQDFLARSEAVREADARRVRLAGKIS
ncbi:bucentaur or craniofacial development-domain-containing protein [Apodospora peruviana]|uniref:SWR1-complex protein 5 n=1 Tax=Apodospora peruviana TaxID=516989 RepID=A0AAE0ICB7_9PEZI|nr:bucentaur or craniofacial development-domain-containing protein [Apodospora peruviana]